MYQQNYVTCHVFCIINNLNHSNLFDENLYSIHETASMNAHLCSDKTSLKHKEQKA
jgi:hypothetical protein